jgi:hypothetical protein
VWVTTTGNRRPKLSPERIAALDARDMREVRGGSVEPLLRMGVSVSFG